MEFLNALRAAPGNPVVADIKCYSPKEGDLLRGRDPVELAKRLASAGAPALSVVTEPKEFGGSMELLQRVCAAVNVPVLRKDFIGSRQDLILTKKAGASAILLMCSCLEPETLKNLYYQALELGLDPLVETHTQQEMALARELNAELVGINNRDILKLERDDGDVSLTSKLISGAPKGAFVISESSISSPGQVRRAMAAGANAALVGTAIFRARHTEAFYKMLTRPVQVKICGIMDLPGLETCISQGAELLGVVCGYPVDVPWQMDEAGAGEIISQADGGHTTCLVTGGEPEEIIKRALRLRPGLVQLHYRETITQAAHIAAVLKEQGIGVIKTVPGQAQRRMEQFGTASPQDIGRLLDGAGLYGALVDSRGPANAAEIFAKPPTQEFVDINRASKTKTILAGGIHAGNVQQLLKETGARHIDIMSGSEDSPGKKSEQKLRELMERIDEI